MTKNRVRRATVADAPELIRLRAVMLDSMGVELPPTGAAWWAEAAGVMTDRLRDSGRFAAFVVDAPSGGLAACACAWLDLHLPTPATVDGRAGFLANVATDPGHRRRGLARACVTAADDWLAASPAAVAFLHATSDGEALYRSLGWDDHAYPNLIRRWR